MSRNIVHVAHEGDLTQNATVAEYDRFISSMGLLDPGLLDLPNAHLFDPLVSYGLLPGNHDLPTTNFNLYFPPTRYAGVVPWYGGSYPPGTNENNYQFFSGGGDNYIVVNLGYNPASDVIT